MFNARSETLPERASYRGLIARQRCIIPASGFYEWQTVAGKKYPLFIRRKDGASLALAGLWTTWRDPATDETVTSHTIITREANAFMAPIHTRMPVMLDADALAVWLDASLTDVTAAMALLGPGAGDTLIAYRVAPLVNNARNDGPELIEPVAP
jgi:putative SOS response-associated peptidase YedK